MTTEGFRLSPQQRHLWTYHQARGGTALGVVCRVSVRGSLDEAALERALLAIAGEHEILRTVYRDGAQVVRSADDASVALENVDVASLAEGEQEKRVGELLEEAIRTPFDPGAGPMLRATRVRRGEDHHELILSVPALSGDPASLFNLVAEVARAYRGDGLDEEPLQYADIAEWQNEMLAAEESRPGIQYWRQREPAVRGPGAALEIPFQQDGSALAYTARCARRRLPVEVAASVTAAARALGVETRDFLLAGWVALLRRLGGQDEVLVGYGASGRRYEELAAPLGRLARHLPLPLSVEATTPFGELVRAVAGEVAAMEKWQECFDEGGHGPAFCFDHQRLPDPVEASGVTFAVECVHAFSPAFACRLSCEESAAGLALALDYDGGAFGAETMERLAGQLQSLLADAAARTDAPIRMLDALGPEERTERLFEFNATAADYPRDLCAHEWIEQHVRDTPDAVAVLHGGEPTTYAELDRRANQLAHHLISLGVGPDTMVALCVERSIEMVVGILGILKAGGAYVPVDPAYPKDRLEFLFEDTSAPVVVTKERFLADLPPAVQDGGTQALCMDRDLAAIEAHPDTKPESGVQPGNLVYVIYTSGSTGKPKGVVITHERLVISNTARVNGFGHTPKCFLLLSSVAFDSSVVGLFWSLCGGGTLCLMPEGLEKDVSQIPRTIAEQGVSHLLTLPSFYNLILESADPGQLDGLHTSIVAGEACPRKMVERHKQLLPHVGLFSEYGATETTVFSSIEDCLTQELTIAPLGKPIDNAEMYVLDSETLQPCPLGVPGEVHFGGIAIALGYWRRPSLTAERFVPDPFIGQAGIERPGARLYKSGDLARHLESGDMEFLGRIDNQVKIRGYRVELEEIEIAMLAHPQVEEAVVLAVADRSDEKRLIGYAVVPGGASGAPSVSELRELLLVTLPDFMVPAVWVFLDDFPRTPNGKVDRKNLPEPGSERPELEGGFEAPRNPTEEALAGIWGEVLGLEQVGVNDNFFELGGDSILSIQIVSRAKKAGLKLTPRLLFENQTVAEQALVAIASGGGEVTSPTAEQGPVTGEVPLTPVQHWFFDLGLPDPSHWNMPVLLEARRPVTAEHLEAAAHALVAHHDGLRLRFAQDGETWKQRLAGPGEETAALVAVEDLSGVAAEDRAAELGRRAAAHHAALDLENGPLVRLVLFEHGDAPQRVLWIVHHLAIDGVSWRILLDDLGVALEAIEAGGEPRFEPKTTSIKTWAERLQAYAAAPERQAEMEAWAALAGAAASPLPLDDKGDDKGDSKGVHGSGGNVESSARRVRVSLGEEDTKNLLSEVPRTYNTQINDVLLTAMVHTFAEWTGQDALLLNLEGHGREEIVDGVDLSRTVGWFTTDYPVVLRDTVPFEPGAAIRSTKEQLRAVPNQGFGFGVGRYLCDPQGTTIGPAVQKIRSIPRPTLGFNYLGQFDQVFRDDARFGFLDEPTGEAMAAEGERVFQIEVYGQVSGGRLELDFEYSEALHERATIEKLGASYLETLRALIAHCLTPDAGGFTASDFADFEWDASDLEGIANAIRDSQGDGGEKG